ncbi:MAG TPA: hypothetical protein PKC28_00400 [Bdellovibrionales bacterium]|nr:hypothetical protein [Bdellovibrionales bacterium]
MKAALALLVILAATANARALEYSTYTCEYMKVDSAPWDFIFGASATYKTELGWNESKLISKSAWGDETGEQVFGLCSEVASYAPESVYLNIHLIVGRALQLEPDGGCLYTGREITASVVKEQLTSDSQYLHVRKTHQIGGHQVEFLHISAVRPHPADDAVALCQKIFTELTGRPAPPKSIKANPAVAVRRIRI